MWFLLAAVVLADSTVAMRVSVAPAETLTVAVSAGNGRTVVLVPGLFGAVYGYRKVVPLLTAEGYRVIVIEPLAVGQSGRPRKADYSLTAQADRIAAVLDTLRVRDAVIVAHALAGSMALRLAYRHPEMVGGVVSLNGGPAEAAASPGFRRAMQFVPWVKWMGGASLLQKQIPKSLRKASGDPSWVTDDVVREYTAGASADLDGTLYAYLAMADCAGARETGAAPGRDPLSRAAAAGAGHEGWGDEGRRDDPDAPVAGKLPGRGDRWRRFLPAGRAA